MIHWCRQHKNFIKKKCKGISTISFFVVVVAILLIILGTVIHIIEVEREKETIPIAYGHEIRTDIDGDKKEDRILVTDNVSGNRAFTQITASMDNGDTIFKDYEGHFSSSIVTGDLSGNGKADVLLVRYDTGSTYGAAEVSVLYFDNGAWAEYSEEFISNPDIKMEQPKSFSPENWMEVSILEATIVEKDEKTILRLTLNEDIQKNMVKVIDASYCEDGWYIEDMQRKTVQFVEGGVTSQITSAKNIGTLQSETDQSTQIEGSTLDESNSVSETEFTGRYVDDLGTGWEKCEMIITKQDDGNYLIDFGVYKLLYVTAAAGKYHPETNTLSFEGLDDTGHEIAVSIFPEENYLSVTVLKSPYSEMSKGTVLKYYPEGYYPVEEY